MNPDNSHSHSQSQTPHPSPGNNNPPRRHARQPYAGPFYIPQRPSSNHEPYPLQLRGPQPSQAHYPPSPTASALNTGVYTQRPAYISPYPVQANPSGGAVHPQLYGYLSLPPHNVQPQSDGILHPIQAQMYSTPRPGTSPYSYVQRISPDSGSHEHSIPDHLAAGQSPPHHPQSFPGEPAYPSLQYVQQSPTSFSGYHSRSFDQNSPSLYQTYIPAYHSYYRGSPTHDNGSTWWYLPHPSSPGTAFESSPLTHQPHPRQFDTAAGPSPAQNDTELAAPHDVSSHSETPQTLQTPHQTGSADPAELEARMSSLSMGSTTPVETEQYKPRGAPTSTIPVRRPYHPNPPVSRSEWVMWVGNVPSDAAHDELWKFFNRETRFEELPTSDPASSSAQSSFGDAGGVISVFLISRSNCAFVNFDTKKHLESAVTSYNGKPLRPLDARCAKLVCRIRRPDDDLKAGVGVQRGMGMHIKWIRDKRPKDAAEPLQKGQPSSPPAKADCSSSSDFSLGSSPGRPAQQSSTSSGSYASTTSSFLARYFPKRYFILKSLNEADLKLSIESSVWATQHHNEGILDQAFQTSKDVYLIFSANKSGEFFGYARMAGPIRPSERKVSWASRNDPTSGPSVQSRLSHGLENSTIEERLAGFRAALPPVPFLSPSEHRMASSPGVLTPEDNSTEVELRLPHTTRGVPIPNTEPEPAHTKLSYTLIGREHGTLDPRHLDNHTVPVPAPKVTATIDSRPNQGRVDSDGVVRKDTLVTSGQPGVIQRSSRSDGVDAGDSPKPIGPPSVLESEARGVRQKETWGNPFPIEWIRTDRLSFQRTRHLRNPWNHDREVKVSRDGTELEPTVGEALLTEWEKLRTLSPPPPQPDSAADY